MEVKMSYYIGFPKEFIYGDGVIGIQLSNVLKNMAYVEDSLIIIYTR